MYRDSCTLRTSVAPRRCGGSIFRRDMTIPSLCFPFHLVWFITAQVGSSGIISYLGSARFESCPNTDHPHCEHSCYLGCDAMWIGRSVGTVRKACNYHSYTTLHSRWLDSSTTPLWEPKLWYPDISFRGLPQPLLSYDGIIPERGPRAVPSASFPLQCSPVNRIVRSELLSTLLNNKVLLAVQVSIYYAVNVLGGSILLEWRPGRYFPFGKAPPPLLYIS